MHHSNVASLPPAVVRLGSRLAGLHPAFAPLSPHHHKRAQNLSAALVEQWSSAAGLQCRSQELLNCGPVYLTDCVSVITRRGSRWSRPNIVASDRRMGRRLDQLSALERLYGSSDGQ
jgi:hypothetical protein